MPQSSYLFSKPFSALRQQDRLFLYAVRHWGWAHRKGDASSAAATTRSMSEASSGPKTRSVLQAGRGSKHSYAKLDKHLDLFLRCFAQALPEPLMLKPTQCRCAVVFHEATLLDMFIAVRHGDDFNAIMALQDTAAFDVCERLVGYLKPLVSEIEFMLDAVCQPSVPTLPSSRL